MKHLDKNVLFEKANEIEDVIGADDLIENIMKALDSDTLQDVLEYIDRCYDMDIFKEEN